MSSLKTMTTELAVAFGLLEREPASIDVDQVGALFRSTLKPETFEKVKERFYKDDKLCQKLFSVGMQLRTHYGPFGRVGSLQWSGPKHQSKSVIIPKDLVAANIPVSIKADSNVIFNLAPYKLLFSLPNGQISPKRTQNWYIRTALDEYQDLYSFVREHAIGSYPEHVGMYHKRGAVTKLEKRGFAKAIDELPYPLALEFGAKYVAFCRAVAARSAEQFNELLQSTLSGPSGKAIVADLFRRFLRVGDTSYVLCGIDGSSEFAVEVPDLTTVEHEWRFRSLTAKPNLSAEQCKINFELVFCKKGSSSREYLWPFWTEVRWSHRKFGGNPESKLYKAFDWAQVPFFTQIYSFGRVSKISPLGSGGFGSVYVARIAGRTESVAVKELQLNEELSLPQEQELRARFKREVAIQSSLSHRNIMTIVDSELDEAVPWFATLLAPGTLQDLLVDLKGDHRRIARIFTQVLNAIEYAHSRSVIHRDIKPANVFVFDGDVIKVGDFGLGKSLAETATGVFSTLSDGSGMGSIPYAAPEQLESFRHADCRSDIYALGVTLYAMTLGQEPITLRNIEFVDSPFRSFITRCVASDPLQRYQTLTDVMDAFKQILR